MAWQRAIEAAPPVGHVNVSCQCRLWPFASRCRRPMTQEDLLCDDCRNGKCGMLTVEGQPSRHVVFAGFGQKPRTS